MCSLCRFRIISWGPSPSCLSIFGLPFHDDHGGQSVSHEMLSCTWSMFTLPKYGWFSSCDSKKQFGDMPLFSGPLWLNIMSVIPFWWNELYRPTWLLLVEQSVLSSRLFGEKSLVPESGSVETISSFWDNELLQLKKYDVKLQKFDTWS